MVGLSYKELSIALTLYVALSFVFCKLFIALAKRNGRFAGRPEDLTAIQAAHDRIVPRVGGIPIFATVALAALVVADHLYHDYLRFVGAASLLFAAGLCEDLGLRVSPRLRLLAAASASLAAVLLLGVWLPRADVPLLDLAIQWSLFGVPLTVLLTSGVSHAFNMIDGVNGLAGLCATTTSLCIAAVSYLAGVPALAELSLVVAAGVVGFLAWNFPHGKIFLGDAGAYTLGFVLSWFAIALLQASGDVTPWAMLLAFLWPVADMLLAIRRRRVRKADAMAPDRMHFHQLVMRLLRSHILPQRLQARANALTTVLMAPFVIAPGLAGLALWNRPAAAFLACCLFFALFFATYEMLLKYAPGMIKKAKRMYKNTSSLPGYAGEVGPGE
jgi:UDP-N-acetylmuramyl pentapeptide phosphotransferase/UDP-N-acetylglucosamine-1-phosphate transferase